MKMFFHVDRVFGLKEGDIINKEPYRGESLLPSLMPFADDLFIRHLNKISSNGLSAHGARYLIKPGQGVEINTLDFMIELHLEYVRHIYQKNKPSRFQSMFAFDNYENAKKFKNEKKNRGAIFEIDYSGLCFIADKNWHAADMRWLTPSVKPEIQKHNAMSYWEGKPFSIEKHYDPQWEYIIELPVKIIREIVDDD